MSDGGAGPVRYITGVYATDTPSLTHPEHHNTLAHMVDELATEAHWRRFRTCGCAACTQERTGS